MSEVKRYVFQHVVRDGTSRSFTKKVQQFTLADDFDRVTAERDALQLQLNQRDERIDRLETDKRAMTETHVLYTWLRKKCDQRSNDVVAVHMNIGHDWSTVHDLDTDLRAMIDREEP